MLSIWSSWSYFACFVATSFPSCPSGIWTLHQVSVSGCQHCDEPESDSQIKLNIDSKCLAEWSKMPKAVAEKVVAKTQPIAPGAHGRLSKSIVIHLGLSQNWGVAGIAQSMAHVTTGKKDKPLDSGFQISSWISSRIFLKSSSCMPCLSMKRFLWPLTKKKCAPNIYGSKIVRCDVLIHTYLVIQKCCVLWLFWNQK